MNIRRLRDALWISLVVTIVLAVGELISGLISNSLSLVGDSIHVFGDVMAISLSLAAAILAKRHHTSTMTFGYHRAEVIAALLNGISLSLLSAWIIFESASRLFEPPQIKAPVMLVAATFGLAGNLAILALLHRHSNDSLNVKSAFAHVVYDAVSSVAVIAGGVIVYFTSFTLVDPLIAFLIAGLLARTGYKIVRESIHILLEGTPSDLDIKQIENSIQEISGVIDVHDLHIWTISQGMRALSGHVMVYDQMVSQSGIIIGKINEVLRRNYNIEHTTIQIENEKQIPFKRTSTDSNSSK